MADPPKTLSVALPAVERLKNEMVPPISLADDPASAFRMALPAVELLKNEIIPPEAGVGPGSANSVVMPAFDISKNEMVPWAVSLTLLPTVALCVKFITPSD